MLSLADEVALVFRAPVIYTYNNCNDYSDRKDDSTPSGGLIVHHDVSKGYTRKCLLGILDIPNRIPRHTQ